MNKDWLYISNTRQWLMSPSWSTSNSVLNVGPDGGQVYFYGYRSCYEAFAVHPVFYLTSTTSIIDGDGTLNNPYILK